MSCLAGSALLLTLVTSWWAPPAAAVAVQTPASSVTVTPSTVPNGGTIHVSGTASCPAVVIGGNPGALGIRTIGPITTTVENGTFAVDVPLPRFLADPSRPGAYDNQTVAVTCQGSDQAIATAAIHVSGIELARTGAALRPLFGAAVALVLVGWLLTSSAHRLSVRR